MKAWVLKKDLLECSKSLAIHGWVRDFNIYVPCTVQAIKTLHLGYVVMSSSKVDVRLYNPFGSVYTVSVPIKSVSVEHNWFKHSIRLDILPQALQVMKVSST